MFIELNDLEYIYTVTYSQRIGCAGGMRCEILSVLIIFSPRILIHLMHLHSSFVRDIGILLTVTRRPCAFTPISSAKYITS